MTQLFVAKRSPETEGLWLVKWLLGAFLTSLLLVVGAWASGVSAAVHDHEKRVTRQEETLKNIDSKLDEIRADVKELKNAR